jgi:hypothetical protein
MNFDEEEEQNSKQIIDPNASCYKAGQKLLLHKSLPKNLINIVCSYLKADEI